MTRIGCLTHDQHLAYTGAAQRKREKSVTPHCLLSFSSRHGVLPMSSDYVLPISPAVQGGRLTMR